jgi:hypothetical protein
MITILGYFLQFSATKIAAFLENFCYDIFLQKLTVLCERNSFFCQNALKIATSLPGMVYVNLFHGVSTSASAG